MFATRTGRALLGYGAALAACALLGWFAFVRGSRVPVLWYVDFGFHELGHLVTAPFPRTFMLLAGSVGQVAVPLGLAAYFLFRRRDLAATGIMLAWTGTSAWDVSVYIADAPIEALPIVGAVHDWATLLGPGGWDALPAAAGIAGAVSAAGLVALLTGMVLCLGGAATALLGTRQSAPVRAPAAATIVVRPARPVDDDSWTPRVRPIARVEPPE